MNEKQQRLRSYLSELREPTPPPKPTFETEEGLEEAIFEVASTPVSSTVSSDSVRQMLEKQLSTSSAGVAEEIEESIPGTTIRAPGSTAKPLTERIVETAITAVEKVSNDQELSFEEEDVLEAIVFPGKRPVLDIINGKISTPPPDWSFLNDYSAVYTSVLPSIGRIDVPQMTNIPYAGTGFFVGDGLLMTNRHVARLFVQGVGKGPKFLSFLADQTAVFDPEYEVGDLDSGSGPNRYEVVEPLVVHPHWDMALLRVKPTPGSVLPPPLKLAQQPPPNFGSGAQPNIVVIGYPALDNRNDLQQQMEIFRNLFGRKRLMPGFLTGFRDVPTKWTPSIRASTHDASTLGGNSGSAIIDLTTGTVLSLHFGGRYLVANFGVPTWELTQDANLNEYELNFTPYPGSVTTAATTTPIWISSWNTVQPIASESPAAPPATGQPLESPSLPVAPDWFERVSDTDLIEAMRRNQAETERLIRETLLKDEAEDLISDLRLALKPTVAATTEEGILDFLTGGPTVDPSLPEIIFLHGIMGGHLASTGSFGGRLWLSPLAWLAGGVATRLTLGPDGEQNGSSPSGLFPDGHIRMVYEKAARKWRMGGFVVHEFSFDWRKSINNSADRLHMFIESLRLERPAKKYVLVGHSMGGLVIALYAARHPEWSTRVTQSVFLGSPLRGSYAPIEALLGTYALFPKFALADRTDGLDAYMGMARTLPGLLDMLPDPEIFPDAAILYQRNSWPTGKAPAQMWLDQSLKVKRLLATSPILETARLVVSLDHPTVADVGIVNDMLSPGNQNRRGDGTVPAQSAAASVKGVTLYRGTNSHGDLPREDAVIQAVSDLIKNGSCNLARLTDAEINDPTPIEEAPTETIEEATSAGLTLRLNSGIFTQRDVDFLLRADNSTIPGPV